MAYTGQDISELDETKPDGDSETVSILDDSDREIKRSIKQTGYSWGQFTNGSGATLNKGDVVATGPGIQNVVFDDVVSSFSKFVVAVEDNIAPALVGLFARSGIVPAKINGLVTSLHYVRKSAVAGMVEDTGVSAGSTIPAPVGSLGIAMDTLTGGLCRIYLFEHGFALAPPQLSTPNFTLSLTNRTGFILSPGDVVTADPANDLSVIFNDIQTSFRPVLVAYETIPNITVGRFIQAGLTKVLCKGPITRFNYLKKSTTNRALEDTGIAIGDTTVSPSGTVGFAVGALVGAGPALVDVILFGTTRTAFSNVAIAGFENLTGLNNVISPNTKYDISFSRVVLVNPVTNETVSVSGAPLTCDISIQGRNGRDQSSVFTASSWLYLFATWDGVSLATRWSVSPTGPTLANGETHFAYAGAIRFNSSSQLVKIRIRGDELWYEARQSAIVDGRAIVETAVNLSSFIPPNALSTVLNMAYYGNSNFNFRLRVISGVEWFDSGLGIIFATGSMLRMQITIPNFGQQFLYLYGSDPGAVAGINVDVVGYR